MVEPGVHLAGVEAKRHCGAKGERGVLAPIIIHAGVAHLDSAVLHRVQRLQRRHNFAASEDLHLKLAVSRLVDGLREHFRCAKNCIERFREARRQAPAYFRRALRNRRGGDNRCARCSRCADRRSLDEFTTFDRHYSFPLDMTSLSTRPSGADLRTGPFTSPLGNPV